MTVIPVLMGLLYGGVIVDKKESPSQAQENVSAEAVPQLQR